jgi:SAM-dependent methyltransferase
MCAEKTHGELAFTGERVVPGKTPPFLVLEHLVRYRFAARFTGARRVLDIGCGTGYGASILAQQACLVVGIDSAPEAIFYAQKNYPRINVIYALADCRTLPFREGSFDLAVMFEVLEHVVEQNQCLGEIQRVLAPDGMLILSTPNAADPTKVIEDVNPFHCKELTESELLELLRPHFAHVRVLLQHELSASSIQAPADERAEPVELTEDFSVPSAAKYFIAVCGARAGEIKVGRSLGVGGIEHQIAFLKDLRQSQKEIQVLVQQMKENEREYAKNLAAHQEVIENLRLDSEALRGDREEAAREYAKNLTALQEEIAVRDRQLGELERQNAARRMELEWLYRWIPINKLARNLLYGKNLRRKLTAKLGIRV